MGERLKKVPAALVTTAALICFVGWTAGLVLVAFGRVVPDWLMAAVLLGAALVVVVVRRVRSGPANGSWPVRLAAWFAAISVVLGAADDLLGARYFVYDFDGCTVAARETAFLMAGSGEVFVAGPLGFAIEHGSYRIDDGGRPFSTKNVVFDQNDGSLSVRVRGTPGDPVLDHDIDPVDC